jgi:hypothetical protein
MATTRLASVNDILNRAAAECGLAPIEDPFGSIDPNFVQMRYLLLTAGEELVMAHPWEFLTQSHQIITEDTDSGVYALPDDFAYMIDQTGWERKENVAMRGPLTPQEWTYLQGRDLVNNSIYASFRVQDGNYTLFPAPAPAGLDINFEYISTQWVRSATAPYTYQDELLSGGDTPLYDRTLLTRMLKAKWLEASGFDTTKAQADVEQMFGMLIGKDKGAAIVNASSVGRGYPYLNAWGNVGDSGFGH